MSPHNFDSASQVSKADGFNKIPILKKKMTKIKIFEMFAGYGGASFALKKAEIPFECIGFSEIDKYAIQCYKQNHNGKCYGDCTKIDPNKLPDFDLLTGGFPCQSFSIAGKREGFAAKDKGNLFFEICKIAKVKQPKYMVLENVKGILSHDNGETHNIVVRELQKLGYGVAWKCLNSKEHGIPQNRERVFYVCKLGGWNFMEFQFPYKEKLKITIKDILEDNVDDKYYLSKKAIAKIKRSMCGENNIIDKDSKTSGCIISSYYKIPRDGVYVADFRYDEGLRIRKLSASMRGGKEDLSSSILIHSLQLRTGDPKKGGTGHLCKDDGTSYCLDTGNTQAIEIIRSMQKNAGNMKNISTCLSSAMGEGGGQIPIIKNNWRRLTPTECFRLMGFLDDNINLDNLSDTQKYKLAGNGWDINLVSKIFKNLLGGLKKC